MTTKSLKKEATKTIEKNFPKLAISSKQEWSDRFSSDKSYYWILLAISTVFFIIILKNCFPNFKGFNWITLSKKTADTILENRIGNIATLVGFSLSIATFLITNTEKKGKENREALIKKTFLYPTLYFALVILLFFFVVSFCKDVLPERLFCDFVLCLHYLIVGLIIAVILLFKNIIHIFNPNFTDEWLEENVILSVKKELKYALLEEVSSRLYEAFINSIDSVNLNKEKKMRWETLERQVLKIPDNKEIIDINLYRLKKTIIKYSDTEIYPSVQPLHIFAQPSHYLAKHLFSLSKTNDLFKSDLLKAFKFSKPVLEMLSFKANYQPLLKKRLTEAIKKDNEEDFKTIFLIYHAVFDIFFEITRDSKAANPHEKVGYNLLHTLQWDINELLNVAIENDRPDFFSSILHLVEQNIYRAFKNRQITPFVDYLKIYTSIYPALLYKKACSNQYLKNSCFRLRMIHNDFLNADFERADTIVEKQIINLFFIRFYNAFAQLLYGIVSIYTIDENLSTDVQERVKRHFEENLEDLNKGIKSYKIHFTPSVSNFTETQKTEYLTNIERAKYAFRVQFAIQSWVTNLYRWNKIKEADYQIFLKEIRLSPNSHLNFVNEVMELVNPKKQKWEGIYLDDWGYVRDETRSLITRGISTEHWLKFSLATELVKNHFLIDRAFNEIPIDTLLYHYKDEIVESILEIKNNQEKWRIPLRLTDFESLEWSEKAILISLKKLKRRHELYQNKVRAEQPLSTKKVEDFKEKVKKSWESDECIISAFEHFNAVKPLMEDNEQLQRIGTNQDVHNLKEMFVEKESINLISDVAIGSYVSQSIDNYFFSTVLGNLIQQTFSNPHEAIKASIENLRKKGIEPNIIILSSEIVYMYEFHRKSSDFVYNWSLKDDEKGKIGIGLFMKIPVIDSLSDNIKNQIIVANFNQAFELEILENEEWIDKRLCVNVKAFSREEAVEEYNRNPDTWKVHSDGVEFSSDEAVNYISNIVQVEFFSKLRIKILDKEAFEVASFKS